MTAPRFTALILGAGVSVDHVLDHAMLRNLRAAAKLVAGSSTPGISSRTIRPSENGQVPAETPVAVGAGVPDRIAVEVSDAAAASFW